MGEIYDDHYVELSWSEGVGIGGDCGFAPPTDHPAYGGINSWIVRASQRPANVYRCKFCGSVIGFINRKAYNRLDGTPHTCLADAKREAAHGIGEKN
jgi:hypothetical protein